MNHIEPHLLEKEKRILYSSENWSIVVAALEYTEWINFSNFFCLVNAKVSLSANKLMVHLQGPQTSFMQLLILCQANCSSTSTSWGALGGLREGLERVLRLLFSNALTVE